MRRAALAGELRDQAFDGGAVMAVELAQIDLPDDLAARAVNVSHGLPARIAAPIVG
jgi:hypothetical protein